MKYENLFISKGVYFSKDIEILQSNGTPVNVTGYTGKITLAKHFESVTKWTANVSIYNALNGIIRVELSAEETALLPTVPLVYSVLAGPNGGDQLLILQGQAFVSPVLK